MSKHPQLIHEALAVYRKDSDRESVRKAEEERQEVLKRFPLKDWPSMPLDKYALGQEHSEDTFCWWMEFGAMDLGSIRGGSSRKLIIYKHKDKPGWYFDPTFKDEKEAWEAVRGAFVQAFQKAQSNDWNSIEELVPLQSGPALRLKALHVYFSDGILPVYSQKHIRHFLRLLGRSEAENRALDVVQLNRALLAALRGLPELKDWSTKEIERFLYWWSDPREVRRIVKIAPGHDARYWGECRAGGYICVGWDEVGDLRAFESKESFLARFDQEYAETYKNHRPTLKKKADEVWTLIELEPGDIIVANKGISRILGIGKVVEPGYEWNLDRSEFRHTVRVEWDASYKEREIPAQKRWALVTVDAVPATLYEKIVDKTNGEMPRPPLDPLYDEVAAALESKGQVILYGPPGTGKTYTARRFAVWYLLRREGSADAHAVLTDPKRFELEERRISTTQLARRVWWVVANPKEWSWGRIFEDRKVAYRYGRLKRNYPLVQPGDLVIGYQASPDKRVVALARVSKGLEAKEGSDPTIELVGVSRVNNGLTYDELLADSILGSSEPMRFRNQGTLFALTADEAGHALALLAERDPDIQAQTEGDAGVGFLTRLTFHPSYSYEDFIEGFRPTNSGGGALALRLEDGVFKRLCQEAQAHPNKPFMLLIDEINRANIAKVFGEVVTLLEKDKRGLNVTLPQSKESFTIPSNVYLLGTMNTADRSIKLLDAALRRRFAFVELMPNVQLLRGARAGTLPLDDFLEELNRRIARTEGREKQIGHSFLLDDEEPVTDPEEFARRFRQEILPLLQEYCYDDYTTLATYLGDKLVDKEGKTLNQDCLSNSDSLLAALAEEFGRRGGS